MLHGPARRSAARRRPSLRAAVEPLRDAARGALDAHVGWLQDRLDSDLATRDPRLGPEKYAAKLWATLDAELTPDERARTAPSTTSSASRARSPAPRPSTSARPCRRRTTRGAVVRRALRRRRGRAARSTTRRCCRCAVPRYDSTTAFVREHDLVTVYDDPVEIVEMPEIHRGVAVAYCDAPGPLETAALPTFFAVVADARRTGTPTRVASFYREYNARMLQNLTVHEAMPGHVLQLAHSRRRARRDPGARGVLERPVRRGLGGLRRGAHGRARLRRRAAASAAALAIRLQQLKMQLRMTINAILDVRVHTRGMTEDEAMRLMQVRGHQEEGEAVGKWRRALLTSTPALDLLRRLRRGARPRARPARRPSRRGPTARSTTPCSPTARRRRATCAPSSASDRCPLLGVGSRRSGARS